MVEYIIGFGGMSIFKRQAIACGEMFAARELGERLEILLVCETSNDAGDVSKDTGIGIGEEFGCPVFNAG